MSVSNLVTAELLTLNQTAELRLVSDRTVASEAPSAISLARSIPHPGPACPCCGNPYEAGSFALEQQSGGVCRFFCQHCGCLVDFGRIPLFTPCDKDKC